MISTFLFSLFFGFISASIVYPIFHRVLRFRAEWTGTFIACMMTSMVCGVTFATATICYPKGTYRFLLVLLTTVTTSFIASLLSFRLIIRSESGRSLNLVTSTLMAAFLVAPATLLGLAVHAMSDTP